MNKTYKQIVREMNDLNEKINNAKAEEREALQQKFEQLKREAEIAREAQQAENLEREAQNLNQKANKSEIFRETLQKAMRGELREVTLTAGGTGNGAGTNSGAIPVTIKDLIPNLEEGTELPKSLKMVFGVVGNTIIPTEINDVELEEAGEIEVKNDQVFDFDHATATPHRVTLSCDISRSMINNVAFDVMAVAQRKFAKANRKYLARKTYSQANWTGNKGGFAGLAASSQKIGATDSTVYKDILKVIAGFINEGFSPADLCLTIDAVTEAAWKCTPIDTTGNNAGWVIQDGKLAGYDYTVSHHINTVLGGDAKTASGNTDTNKIYKTTKSYLGVGFYNALIVQQHGDALLNIDATSKEVAKKNCVNLTINTEYSFTNMSGKIYNEDGSAVQAFGIYEIA